jgi:hypothetical protein
MGGKWISQQHLQTPSFLTLHIGMIKLKLDYQELMEYTENTNYARLKCFHCLLSPPGDDPIFIGTNRILAKGLNDGTLQGDGIQYPYC